MAKAAAKTVLSTMNPRDRVSKSSNPRMTL